jgi:hypothetical protein
LKEELRRRAHDVGEGFIERAGFIEINQVGRVLRHAMRQLVRDDVEGAGEIVPALTTECDVGRQSLAEHDDAVAVVEGVDVEVGVLLELREDVVPSHRVDEDLHRAVRVVEPAPVEALEVVVVGPTGVDVSVVNGAVGPGVIGVRRDVVVVHVSGAIQDADQALDIRLHVVGRDCRRTEKVRGEKAAAGRRYRDLLRVAQDAGGPADRTLPLCLAIAVVEDD